MKERALGRRGQKHHDYRSFHGEKVKKENSLGEENLMDVRELESVI